MVCRRLMEKSHLIYRYSTEVKYRLPLFITLFGVRFNITRLIPICSSKFWNQIKGLFVLLTRLYVKVYLDDIIKSP